MNFLKRLVALTVSLYAILASSASVAAMSETVVDQPEVLSAWVDGLIEPLMRNHNSPSGTVAISRRGKVILARGYGYQDHPARIPVDPYRTLFRPASVSKLFTWVAIMQLVERGKLDLDTDVNHYLKSVQIEPTFDEPVTLRHIMTHTAGFEDGGAGYLTVGSEDDLLPLAEAMRRYQPRRVNPPGVQTAYSNYATSLAGLIVEDVSGSTYQDYIKANIFDVLDMSRSTFLEPVPKQLADDLAKPYLLHGARYREMPFEWMSGFAPAAALSATSIDMIQFAQALLNNGEREGGRILRATTVNEMFTRNFTHHPMMMGMALGIYETEENDIRLLRHAGDTQYYHSELVIDQKNDLAFFISFNGAGGSIVRSTFAAAFYDAFFPVTEAPPIPPPDFASYAHRYEGTYQFWRGNFSTFEKAFRLLGNGVEVTATTENSLLLRYQGGVKEYVEVHTDLFRERDPSVRFSAGASPRLVGFQTDSEGEVQGLVLDGRPFLSAYRARFYQTARFSKFGVLVCMLVFAGTLARYLFIRVGRRSNQGPERWVRLTLPGFALLNLGVLVWGWWVAHSQGFALYSNVPNSFKLFLWAACTVPVMTLYLLFHTSQMWRQRQLVSGWARFGYTIVMLCGLFMTWFYCYWNLLGPRYQV